MGATISMPKSTPDVVRLKKVDGVTVSVRAAPFFKEGYPIQPKFRHLLSESDWWRLDKEFLDVWNEQRASNLHPAVVCCSIMPGAYCCLVPVCWLSSIFEERASAIHELVAKVNKYIMTPRGMLMKQRMIIESHDNSQTRIIWYEIALTENERQRLAKERYLNETECRTCLPCCKSQNDFVITEDTVGEDAAFRMRWAAPAPSARFFDPLGLLDDAGPQAFRMRCAASAPSAPVSSIRDGSAAAVAVSSIHDGPGVACAVAEPMAISR